MTIDEVFELRNQGYKEKAYEAARAIYAVDKGPYASAAMFWTAIDMLKVKVNKDQIEDAKKIYLALERLLNSMNDEKGWMHDAFERCHVLIEKGEKRANLSYEGPKHLQTGIWGEELAVEYLSDNGYIILERDWHSKHRDIDIIAYQDDCIVFIEVKTRRNRDFSDPQNAVNYQKRKNLLRAINHYINYRRTDKPWRFDVITIVGELGSQNPEINHIKNFSL